MRTRLQLVALGLCLAACAAPTQGVRRVWLPSYAFGAFGGGDLDLRDVCASGADEISIGATWATLGVSLVTLGVYTPREVRVRCKRAR